MSTSGEPRWLTPTEQRDWRSFLGGVTVLMDQLDRDLRNAHGISLPEFEILVRLSEAPNRTMRMAELASRVALSRSRATHTVSRLEGRGLVRREPCDEDGRGVQAVLTAAGTKLHDASRRFHVEGIQDYFLANASTKELEAIGRVMERVLSQLGGRRF